MRGSLADYNALALAIDDHDRKERVAAILATAWAYDLANEAYVALIPLARRCGYQWTFSHTVLEWSRRRVATFQQMTGRAA